jgi:hypothetical protein
MNGGIDLLFTNDPFEFYFRVYGSVRIYVDMPWYLPDINVTLARVDARVNVSGYGIKVYVTACAFGICLNGSLVWNNNLVYWGGGIGAGGEPPFLGAVEDGILYLHAGADAWERAGYMPLEISETFMVDHIATDSDGFETVLVTGFGISEEFAGVTGIIVNAGDGDDTIFIGKNVLASVEMYGGDGNDALFASGSGRAMLYGGSGSDLLICASGYCEFHGGPGNDTAACGNGNSLIYGDDGDDTFRVGNNYDQLFGGDGWDTVVMYYDGSYGSEWYEIENIAYAYDKEDERNAPVVIGNQVAGTINDLFGATLSFSNGDEVYFAPGSGDKASLTRLYKNDLPAELPAGWKMVSALQVIVWNGLAPIQQTSAMIKISFIIPALFKGFEFVILFWDESANNGTGGWVEIASTSVQDVLTEGQIEHQEVWVDQIGIYVLAMRSIPP